jgi:hypothetical protein
VTQSARWANANHQKSGEILQKYTHIDDAALQRMTRKFYATTLEPEQINPTLRLAAKYAFTAKLVTGSEVIIPV